jgi:hypothetical protein
MQATNGMSINPLSTVGTKKIDGFSVGWLAVMCLHTREKNRQKRYRSFCCFLEDLPTELNRHFTMCQSFLGR